MMTSDNTSYSYSYNYVTAGLRPGEHMYNLRRAMDYFEKGYLKNILVLYDWNIAQTAMMLDISPETLMTKMKKHALL